MSICFVVSDAFGDKILKYYDPHDAQQCIDELRQDKEEAESASDLFEKPYSGYKYIKQIRPSGQFRVVAFEVPQFDICELVQLTYVYKKNESGEPPDDTLEKIDEAAIHFYGEASDWPPAEQSEYLDKVQTQLPDPK